MQVSRELKFLLEIMKICAKLTRRFDHRLNGISSTELIILQHLFESPDLKLRRIDLAEKVGLTASGITRLLLPMEKIGLVGREDDERDARVKFVTLTVGGKEKLKDEIVFANSFAKSLIPEASLTSENDASKLLGSINALLVS